MKRQLAAIKEQVAANEVRRDKLKELVAGYADLRAKGMISQNEVIAKQEQYDETVAEIANARAKEVENAAAVEKKRDDLAEMERQKLVEIDQKKAEVDDLRMQIAVGSTVRAPINGIIREIRLGRGDVAAAGAVLATVGQDAGTGDQVMTVLRGYARKRVTVGMEAHVVPDSAKKEEYGSMRGRVVSVSYGDVSF